VDRLTSRQSRWTPLPVDARRCCRTDASELLAAVVLDLLRVADAIHIVAVLELARHADQEYLTVFDFSRIFAVI